MTNEQTANEEERETASAPNTSDGNIPKPLSKVERAELAVKRLEEAEKRIDDKIAQLTELRTDKILSGTAGGHIETMKTAEQVAQEKAQKTANEIVKAFR